MILRLFHGEVVTEQTEWYTLNEARTHLRPYTSHSPRCAWPAVTPSGGRLAGKYNLGMLCVAAGVQAGFDALDVNWNVACERAAEQGRQMDRSRLRCVVGMHIAETREQAIADIRFGTDEYIRYLNNNQPRFHVPPGEDMVDWVVEHRIACVGTPEDAIEHIEQLQGRAG